MVTGEDRHDVVDAAVTDVDLPPVPAGEAKGSHSVDGTASDERPKGHGASVVRVTQLLGGVTAVSAVLVLSSIGVPDLGLTIAVLIIVGWATARTISS